LVKNDADKPKCVCCQTDKPGLSTTTLNKKYSLPSQSTFILPAENPLGIKFGMPLSNSEPIKFGLTFLEKNKTDSTVDVPKFDASLFKPKSESFFKIPLAATSQPAAEKPSLSFNFKPLESSAAVKDTVDGPPAFSFGGTQVTFGAKETNESQNKAANTSSNSLFTFGATNQTPSTTNNNINTISKQPEQAFSLFKATQPNQFKGDAKFLFTSPLANSQTTAAATNSFQSSSFFGSSTSTPAAAVTPLSQPTSTNSSLFFSSLPTNSSNESQPKLTFGQTSISTTITSTNTSTSSLKTTTTPNLFGTTTTTPQSLFNTSTGLSFGGSSSSSSSSSTPQNSSLFGSSTTNSNLNQQTPTLNSLLGGANAATNPSLSFPQFSLNNTNNNNNNNKTPPQQQQSLSFFQFGATSNNSNNSNADQQAPSAKFFINNANQPQQQQHASSFIFNPNASANFNFTPNNQNGIIHFSGGNDQFNNTNTSASNLNDRKFRRAARRTHR
jgi:hypothetical protein